ncbi:MAG TPA: DUF3501 family protein [Candidatus Dormibacteraeota bacterium]|jgi:hypothetical protein
MSGHRLGRGEVRTGAAYEAERAANRSRLAESASSRRVSLGADLVLVFEAGDTVRASLEELLRAERVADEQRIAAETAAFADMVVGDDEIAATLYLDIADPAALADRLAELGDLSSAVSLDLSGARVSARPERAESGPGAWRLVFAVDEAQRRSLLEGGPASVVVDHPVLRATAALDSDQVRAVAADLRR